jgi:hypothetical protein
LDYARLINENPVEMNQIKAEKILPDLQEMRGWVVGILLQGCVEISECLDSIIVSAFSRFDV